MLIAESVKTGQHDLRRAKTHGVEEETIPLSSARIANGKVETKAESDRDTACDLTCHRVTEREKMRPFLKRGLERFLDGSVEWSYKYWSVSCV